MKKFLRKNRITLNKEAMRLASVILMVMRCLIILMIGVRGQEFASDAFANHWGRSFIRTYLNNSLVSTDTEGNGTQFIFNHSYLVDSTGISGGLNKWYEAHFTGTEYEMIKGSSVETNVLNEDGVATNVYETKDRFFLPSGNPQGEISWGREDISDDNTYTQKIKNKGGEDYVIPKEYWAKGFASDVAWLRSADRNEHVKALISDAANGVVSSQDVGVAEAAGVSAICRADFSSVTFGCAVSAKELTEESSGVEIAQDHGLYLKTAHAENSFAVNKVEFSGDEVQVEYVGGVSGEFITLCACSDTETFAAAKMIDAESGSITIDVSGWAKSDLSGLTLFVWMEDGLSVNLSGATDPTVWEGKDGELESCTTATQKNACVFATNNEMQCSWNSSSPTDQMVCFGTSEEEILKFWIAGRENESGTIDSKGNIVCLYQAKMLDHKDDIVFNNSDQDYTDEALKNPSLSVQGETVKYTGAEYISDKITYTDSDGNAISGGQFSFQYCTTDSSGVITDTSWHDGMPVNVGFYKIRVISAKNTTAGFEQAFSVPVDFVIEKAVPDSSAPIAMSTTVGKTLKDVEFESAENGVWKWNDETLSVGEIGVQTFSATFYPNDQENYSVVQTSVKVFVYADGTSSTPVEKNKSILWVKEESDGTSAWYGLDNSEGVFEEGSVMWVKWFSEEDTEYEKYYKILDDKHKDSVEDGRLWIFVVGVTKPDGSEYTDFDGKTVDLYVQLSKDWEENDIVAVFVSGGEDEVLDVRFERGVVYPEGDDGNFGVIKLKHFSPYAVYDKVYAQDNPKEPGADGPADPSPPSENNLADPLQPSEDDTVDPLPQGQNTSSNAELESEAESPEDAATDSTQTGANDDVRLPIMCTGERVNYVLIWMLLAQIVLSSGIIVRKSILP